MNNRYLPVFVVLLCCCLTACQLDIESKSNADDPNQDSPTTDKLGGLSIGVITDIRDFEVNWDSEFDLGRSTEATIDGKSASNSDFADGMVVVMELDDDANGDLTTGSVDVINAVHALIGPVTALDPLEIMDQVVVVTGDTILHNVTDNSIAKLNLGDTLKVSGFADANNNYLATRVELVSGGLAEWKLSGWVSDSVADTSFNINDQAVTLNGVTPSCSSSFGNGRLVEVVASQVGNFSDGTTLDTVLSVTCINRALREVVAKEGDSLTVPAEVEGIVEKIDSLSEFRLSGQRVRLEGNISYTGGYADDLVEGARVEVEGDYNVEAKTLNAKRIKYQQRRIEIEGPMTDTDVVVGKSVKLMGTTIDVTSMTDDPDAIVATAQVNDQVTVRGFADINNKIYATRVSKSGISDIENVSVRGPVTRVGGSNFDIMGTRVDTGTARSIAGRSGGTMTDSAFLTEIDTEIPYASAEAGELDGNRVERAALRIEFIDLEDDRTNK